MAVILVVDDDRLICDLLQVALEKEGYEVVTASNGYEALELFIKRRPSLTIVDTCMPGLDGIEVIKQIRLQDSHAAVMVLTGLDSESLKSQARMWDVTEFLSKSAPLSQLMGAVDRTLQKSENAAAACRQEPASIMVVDDDRVLRELLADFLTTRGYQVLAAQDGQTALSMFNEKPPQLVILDIHLPGGMNGVKVLRELRARRYTGSVIALSGVHEDSLLKEMLSLGAVELIAKPFDLAQLSLAIQVGLVLSGCGVPSR